MKRLWILFVLLTFILAVRIGLFYKSDAANDVGDRVGFAHTFLQDPRNTPFGTQTITVKGLLISLPEEARFQYGDKIYVSGKVGEKSYFSSKENRVINQKILTDLKVEKEKSPNFLLALTSFIRQKVSDTFYHYLPQNEAGLLIGIVFGVRSSMEKSLVEAFRQTGVLHVIAASGTNVTMVGGLLLLSLTPVVKRRIALLFTVAGIFFYALLAGFAPSIVRAAIMASFAFGAGVFGRQNYSLLALIFAALIMIFFQPDVILDVGFQLSFLSTLGILYIKPFIDLYLFQKRKKDQFFLFDDFSTTGAAQLATLPIMVFFFSSYSVIGLFVNPLVLWTIPMLMILGGAAAVTSLIIPILSLPFLYLAYPLLLYFEKIITFFAGFSFPVVIDSAPIALVIGYYLILLSLILVLNRRKRFGLISNK